MPHAGRDRRSFGCLLKGLSGRGKDVRGRADMRLLGHVLEKGLERALRRHGEEGRDEPFPPQRASKDQKGPEIIDIGVGRTGDEQVTGGGEDVP